MFEQRINIDRMEQAVALFGSFDENIRLIEKEYAVSVVYRGGEVKISGEPENVAKAVRAVETLIALVNRGEALSEQNVRYCISMVNEGSEGKVESLAGDCICITSKGKPVKAKTLVPGKSRPPAKRTLKPGATITAAANCTFPRGHVDSNSSSAGSMVTSSR